MVTETFKEIKFKPASLALIETCNAIIAEYQAQGLRLTLRQLYYQCVSRNIVPNTQRSYKNLGNVVSDGRLAGLIDWDAIEDRVRQPRMASEWDSVADLVDSAVRAYRLPRWKGQDYYVELWVEKDALAGVLEPIANEYHVCLMVNRGYSSQSAMYESAQRFMQRAEDRPQGSVLLYLGDHDPSGMDMTRDVEARLNMFGVSDLEVRRIALTTAQVRQFSPPPNPAKITDSRAAEYIRQHGRSSWEVDALPPQELNRIIRRELDGLVDSGLVDAVKEREDWDKKELRKAALKIKKRGEE